MYLHERVKLLCHNLFGDFTLIKEIDIKNKKYVAYLSKGRRVMDVLEMIAKDKRYIDAGTKLSTLTIEEVGNIFDFAYDKLCEFLYNGNVPRRFGDLNTSTIYENMRSKVPNQTKAAEFIEAFKEWERNHLT
jgi:hypothetical protein